MAMANSRHTDLDERTQHKLIRFYEPVPIEWIWNMLLGMSDNGECSNYQLHYSLDIAFHRTEMKLLQSIHFE